MKSNQNDKDEEKDGPWVGGVDGIRASFPENKTQLRADFRRRWEISSWMAEEIEKHDKKKKSLKTSKLE